MEGYFTPNTFRFLKQLKKNNKREWFLRHKGEYEAFIKEPALRLIKDFKPYLNRVSHHFVADPRPVGGSLFRIYRDIRFSADKSPYKTHIGIHFRHRSSTEDVHAPGFYVHLEPGECFLAAGVWRPDPVTTRIIRNAILDGTGGWKKFLKSRIQLEGDSLQRPPRGYDRNHPYIQDLKRKDFIASVSISEAGMCKKDILKRLYGACQELSPLIEFLAGALKVAY